MIAEEGQLAKNEVHRVRGGRKARVLREATHTDQARVLGGGSVGIDEMAGARVHTITANQESALRCRPIGKGGDHALLTRREGSHLLAKDDLDPLILGSLTQHLMQAGAQDVDAWGSHFRPSPIANLAKRLAFPTPDQHARNRRALACHLFIEPERLEHADPIARHVQETAAIIGRLGSGLIDLGLNACPLQEQSDDGSSDPAANNQRFSCRSVHKTSFLIIS